MASKYRIGRMGKDSVTHAFCVKHNADGGITLSEVEDLSDAERRLVYAHFGAPRRVENGGLKDGALISYAHRVEPGELAHFEATVYALPEPFVPTAEG